MNSRPRWLLAGSAALVNCVGALVLMHSTEVLATTCSPASEALCVPSLAFCQANGMSICASVMPPGCTHSTSVCVGQTVTCAHANFPFEMDCLYS